MRSHRITQFMALADLDIDPARADVTEELIGQFGALGRIMDVVSQRSASDEQ